MSRTTKDPATARVMFSSATCEWPTPQSFFDQLNEEFGFVLDVCADRNNRKCEAYYGLDHDDPARRNGLTGDWAADARRLGGSIFMNPVYGRTIGDWMTKAAETARAGDVTVCCIVPARVDTRWFHDALAAGAAVRFVRGRLKFGDAKHSAPFASAVVIFNPPAGTSAHIAGVRPQPDAEDVLELGERDQVRPGPAGEQVLHRAPGKPSLPARRRQRAVAQRAPRRQRDRAGVRRRDGRPIDQRPVRERPGDVLGGNAGHVASARHTSEPTSPTRPAPDATHRQMQARPQTPDSRRDRGCGNRTSLTLPAQTCTLVEQTFEQVMS